MSITTHESLQSCLEVEKRDHQLLLSFPFSQKLEDPSLSKLSRSNQDAEKPYVHPLSRNSFLSSKSLEMCTESLGCETGCGIDRLSHLPPPPPPPPCSKAKKRQPIAKHAASFPPPLSSIGGGVEVRTCREGGRVVIKAVVAASCGVFQAERGNGRLRLSLVKEDGGYYVAEEVDGGKGWSSSRCNGERSRRKLQSLQFCVVGV